VRCSFEHYKWAAGVSRRSYATVRCPNEASDVFSDRLFLVLVLSDAGRPLLSVQQHLSTFAVSQFDADVEVVTFLSLTSPNRFILFLRKQSMGIRFRL
jgi:hypothetical protein